MRVEMSAAESAEVICATEELRVYLRALAPQTLELIEAAPVLAQFVRIVAVDLLNTEYDHRAMTLRALAWDALTAEVLGE
jgi:hypothetical protein